MPMNGLLLAVAVNVDLCKTALVSFQQLSSHVGKCCILQFSVRMFDYGELFLFHIIRFIVGEKSNDAQPGFCFIHHSCMYLTMKVSNAVLMYVNLYVSCICREKLVNITY